MRSKVLFSTVATCLALAGCSSGGMTGTTTGAGGEGGTTGSGGTTGAGGTTGSGGTTGAGGTTGSGGTTGAAGTTGAGGTAGHGGATGTGGTIGTGGAAGHGGTTGTAGTTGSGGSGTGTDGGATVDCTATLPTGGTTYTGTNINGAADGLNYGIWTNGTGGSITVFPTAHAFSTSWNQSMDFLAHLGLDFNTAKAYTTYGTITADFSEVKTGNTGNTFSSIGMYGWMHSPCVEWYINEDSFSGFVPKGSTSVMVDGAMYYISTSTTTGTGGANACESGHTGGWTNMTSTRATPRQCGTVTVSDHFAAWAKQGWSLGSLASVHINVEVGGGMGSIQFPVANVTTTSN